jgi:hypothetical protein
MSELRIAGFAEYRARLEADPAEWHVLDECCHITISRFFRDRGVFEVLRSRVLPDIAAQAKRCGRNAQPGRISRNCAPPYFSRLGKRTNGHFGRMSRSLGFEVTGRQSCENIR